MDLPTKASYIVTDMDDIQHLLNLEAMCRFQAETESVHNKVQDKALEWIGTKYQYQQEYTRLIRLVKCVGMCVAIDKTFDNVDKEKSVQTIKVLNKLRTGVGSDVHPARLNASVVDKCQQQLDTVHNPRAHLSRQKQEFAEIQKALQDLGKAVDGLENGFELNTMRALDQMVGELVPAHNK
ncbi:augmin complex subunit dgt4-like [Drosophila serrata]|uniref:augmin complex subunit dgt4-like n=1 Tax=Drosophila serrata TaxID=7274 RepID=UPI000A1D18D7|nr:augmin complex subunit dgt4-like [Drosophila serrata]